MNLTEPNFWSVGCTSTLPGHLFVLEFIAFLRIVDGWQHWTSEEHLLGKNPLIFTTESMKNLSNNESVAGHRRPRDSTASNSQAPPVKRPKTTRRPNTYIYTQISEFQSGQAVNLHGMLK